MGSGAHGLQELWLEGSVVEVRGSRAQAQQMWLEGLVAPQPEGYYALSIHNPVTKFQDFVLPFDHHAGIQIVVLLVPGHITLF